MVHFQNYPFNAQEDRILSAMYSAGKAISTPELVEQTGYSWVTVDVHLKSLERKGCVIGRRIGKTIYWRIIEEGVRHQMLKRLPSIKKRSGGSDD